MMESRPSLGSSRKKISRTERLARLATIEWRNIWKVFFAVVAVGDILGCWPVFQEGWRAAVTNRKPGVTASKMSQMFMSHLDNNGNNDDNTCSSYSIYYYDACGNLLYVLDWMGPAFCLLCIVEAVIRAQQAREEMLENAALDNFEKKLSRLYSSARNLSAQGMEDSSYHNNHTTTISSNDNNNNDYTTYDEDDILARRTLRFWTPVLFTLSAWGILLPWRTMLTTNCGQEGDTALATVWITQSLREMSKTFDYLVEELTNWVWQVALPFSFWQPHKIYQRILTLLRWVRYFRFAGPLMRMLLKVHDQFWVFLKTQKQTWKVKAEKAKRIIHRSMLFEDIRKIESLNKIKSGLQRVPTVTVFNMARQSNPEVMNKIKEKKQQGKKLRRTLDSLKEQVRRSSKIYPTSEIYDRIRDLSQELRDTVKTTLWSANLISPQTRFSVSWRIVVTCALISELSRICTSYQLYGRVDVSYATMMMSVLGCSQNNDYRGNILTATGRFTRKVVRKLIRLPKEQLLSTCTKSSIASHSVANFMLWFSGAFEMVIDLVCFIDIYVWFFTGELDPEGRVIPKPFFYRCILPGTLSQVLDHPTVPQALPNIMYYTVSAAGAVGYSRMIRWVVAVVPAINMFLVDPIRKYYFRPMEHDEWLRYTESLAVFPTVISGADIRYTMSMSHPNFSELDGVGGGGGGDDSNSTSFGGRRRNSTMTSSSEVDHSRRRSSNLGGLLGDDDDDDAHYPIPSGVRFGRRGSSSANLKTKNRTASFLPPADMGRRVSSSFGLNLDSAHVSFAPRVASSSSFQIGRSTSFDMDSDPSIMEEEESTPQIQDIVKGNEGKKLK